MPPLIFKNMIFIIDSGHNLRTAGKCSADGSFKEYEFTRRVALEVEEHFRNHPTIFPIYLDPDPERNGRTDEEELAMRIERANEIVRKAYQSMEQVLLLSIHCDAALGNKATGATVWISPEASARSDFFAKILSNKIRERNMQGNRISTINVAKYGIVHKTKCPAALLECGFMTTLSDLAFMKSTEGFNKIVNLICDSVIHYVSALHYS